MYPSQDPIRQNTDETMPVAVPGYVITETTPPTEPKRRGALFGALAVVGLLVAFLLAFLLVRGGFNGATKTPTAFHPTDAAAVLAQASKAAPKDVSFTFDGAMKSSGFTFTMKGTGEIVLEPFAGHLTMTTDLGNLGIGTGNNTATTIEEIITSDTIYIKEPALSSITNAKPWIKSPNIGSLDASSYGLGDNFLDYQKLINPKLIGEEVIDGKKTWHLQTTFDSGDLSISGITSTEDIWIDQETSYPAKVVLHMGLSTKGFLPTAEPDSTPLPDLGDISIDYTYIFTKYNSGVTITPPPADEVGDITDLLTPTPEP